MKLFSKLRYLGALLMVLVTVSSVTSPARSTGMVTTMSDYGYILFVETR